MPLGDNSSHSTLIPFNFFLLLAPFPAPAEQPLNEFFILSSDVTSEESHLICNIYDRSEETHSFLGTAQIKPTLQHDHTVDHWYKCVIVSLDPLATRSNFFVLRLTPLESEPISGEIRVQITFEAYKVGNPVAVFPPLVNGPNGRHHRISAR